MLTLRVRLFSNLARAPSSVIVRLAASAVIAATCVATAAHATNLVVNGGFEDGNTGFTSGYIFDQFAAAGTNDLGAGEYSVTSNAALVHQNFTGVPQAGSQFFVANGSSNTSLAVWQSLAINVTQVDVPYRFEAYVSSVVPPVFFDITLAPPILEFEISANGGSSWTGIGSTVDLTGAPAGAWYLNYADTTLTQVGSYLIRLRNNQSAAAGNDFGLDSIYFGLQSEAPSVPEPSTYAMALAGLACGGFSMWRRRKRA